MAVTSLLIANKAWLYYTGSGEKQGREILPGGSMTLSDIDARPMTSPPNRIPGGGREAEPPGKNY
jgi:hypothetical protein